MIREKLNVRCKKHMKGILRLRYVSICSKEVKHVRKGKQEKLLRQKKWKYRG